MEPGKLATTWYPASYTQEIKMSEMELDVGPGRGYRYYAGPTVFPFGWGQSLTTFVLHIITTQGARELSTTTMGAASAWDPISIHVQVTNTGNRTGDEVVCLITQPIGVPTQQARGHRLLQQLVDFHRVHLQPGQSQIVVFPGSRHWLELTDKASGARVLSPGQYNMVVSNGVDQRIELPYRLTGQEQVVVPFPLA